MSRLLGSSKALMCILLAAMVMVLALAKAIDGASALATIKWLGVAFVGATGFEDAGRAVAARPPAPSNTTNVINTLPPPPMPSNT